MLRRSEAVPHAIQHISGTEFSLQCNSCHMPMQQ